MVTAPPISPWAGAGAFGATLAIGDLDRDGHSDLVVGAPYQQVGADQDAGAIYLIYGTRTGLSRARAQWWSQGSTGVKSTARNGELIGDGFFRILDFGKGRDPDLAVHTPDDTYTPAKNGEPAYGTVNVLYTISGRVSATDQLWYPESAGLGNRDSRTRGFGGRCC